MLNGKKILIVGGSSGIGLAIAKDVHKHGGRLIIASRNASEKENFLKETIDEMIEALSFDITSGFHDTLFERIGRIDHLVCTVRPLLSPAPIIETDIRDAMKAFDVKFWSVYRLIQIAHKYMDPQGSITLTSGIAGEKIYRNTSTMAIINAATETLCRSLALEMAPLRVNAVSPGYVEPKSPEVLEMVKHFPAGRLATVEEIAESYRFLMENAYITGSVLVVDGGARMK
jgi:NAD(P)-dependent dehydrogenase (short-subunit alcohol dehydrogenase family)